MTRTLTKLTVLVLLIAVLAGCAAAASFRQGRQAARRADWDAAVAHYRTAVQEDPDKPEYKIALERAMVQAARVHEAAGREFEAAGQIDAAVREYRRASEYEPGNRQLAARVAELDRQIIERIEASRPRPRIDVMRERARRLRAEPVLNPASREPLKLQFAEASVRDILKFIGDVSGINVTFTSDYRDPPGYSVTLEGVTLEQALQQVLSANQLFYKVLNDRTILVIPDNAQNRARYEEQVIRTFYLSHADPQEIVQLLNTIMRIPGVPVIPTFVANQLQNSVTVRGTAPLVAIMEQLVQSNDRPRAEIVIDVQILEVNRTRAKQFGLDLNQYSVTGIFSPEVRPTTTTGSDGSTTTSTVPFNLNTITAGISTADFYAAVPTAVIRFLETDNQTRLVAKPQLRGQEGQEITLNLGEELPIPNTTFGSLGGPGSVATQPISSFNYRPVGIVVEMTPRVTYDGDIVLELAVESSTRSQDVNIAGQNLPSFGTRRVETKIRLRDGESTLLAGLLREEDRRMLQGFPGLMRLPFFRQLFTSNDLSSGQTDVVFLLTPRIVRTHELTQENVDPIYIGSQQNLGLTGPPPLIAAPPVEEAPEDEQEPTPPAGVGDPGVPEGGTLARPGILPMPAPAPPEPGPAPAPPEAGTPADAPPAEPPAPGPEPKPQAEAAAAQPNALQLVVTPPGSEFRVGGGPYTVPISVSNAPRVSTISVTVTFNPAALRVRAVQEGSFMRQGGVAASFAHQVDAVNGRVDITAVRGQDVVGASGTGLVAAILFDPVAPGQVPLGVTGAASGPAGGPVPVQAAGTSVTVR